jgi:hypothetical protein
MVDNYVRKHKLIPNQLVEDSIAAAQIVNADPNTNQMVEDIETTAVQVIADSGIY